MKLKLKFFAKMAMIASSLFILSGCETMTALLDPERPELEAIKSPVDESVRQSRIQTAKVLEAELRCKQNILLAQGADDAARKIEAELATLQSSPSGDVNAITTAYNNTKDIEIDYAQKMDSNIQERKAYEQAAIAEAKRTMIEWFAYLRARSETYRIMKPLLDKQREQYKENKRARDENRPPRIYITQREKDALRVMTYKNHRGFILRLTMYWDAITTAYDAIAYILDSDDISSDEKDELNAMMKDLDDAKVKAKEIKEEDSSDDLE